MSRPDKYDPWEEFAKLIDECGVKFVIGLRQQGHMPTIDGMLANGHTWEEIGDVIGWNGQTARRWYEVESKLPPSGLTDRLSSSPQKREQKDR